MNSFTINRKELWGLLRTMKPFMRQYTKKKALKINAEIVFHAGDLTMAIPDSKVNARCEMRGTGAIYIPFMLLYTYVSKSSEKRITITLLDDGYKIGNTQYAQI
jgi:hypothetical protein